MYHTRCYKSRSLQMMELTKPKLCNLDYTTPNLYISQWTIACNSYEIAGSQPSMYYVIQGRHISLADSNSPFVKNLQAISAFCFFFYKSICFYILYSFMACTQRDTIYMYYMVVSHVIETAGVSSRNHGFHIQPAAVPLHSICET